MTYKLKTCQHSKKGNRFHSLMETTLLNCHVFLSTCVYFQTNLGYLFRGDHKLIPTATPKWYQHQQDQVKNDIIYRAMYETLSVWIQPSLSLVFFGWGRELMMLPRFIRFAYRMCLQNLLNIITLPHWNRYDNKKINVPLLLLIISIFICSVSFSFFVYRIQLFYWYSRGVLNRLHNDTRYKTNSRAFLIIDGE